MQTVGIFSNKNTSIQKQCTAITSNTAMASSFSRKVCQCVSKDISVFLRIKEVLHLRIFLKNDVIFENDVIVTS